MTERCCSVLCAHWNRKTVGSFGVPPIVSSPRTRLSWLALPHGHRALDCWAPWKDDLPSKNCWPVAWSLGGVTEHWWSPRSWTGADELSNRSGLLLSASAQEAFGKDANEQICCAAGESLCEARGIFFSERTGGIKLPWPWAALDKV